MRGGVASASSTPRRVLSEPLLHFLLIGGVLFLLFGWRGGSSPSPTGQAGTPALQIVVTSSDVDHLNTQFARTWQRPPSDEETRALVEDFVRNEIYCREAIAIGLDRDDPVLRRQLRQKMEFIYEDITSWAEPTDEELRAYMEKHREAYLSDPQVAFRQVYVDATKRGGGAESEARRVLARLAAGADPDSVGDRTLLEAEAPLTPVREIGMQFGDEFARRLVGLTPGRWAGPIRSGYGLHMVRISRSVGPRLRDLREVREAVKRDWTAERQRQVKDAAYAKLRERYTVTVEKPTAATVSVATNGGAGAKAR